MAKEFVHANVLSETHGIARQTAETLGLEINYVYDEAVKEFARRRSVPIELAGAENGKA